MFSAKDLFFTRTSGAYTVNNSLRFRSSASAYLSRTPASAGNRTTYTWSGWFKRGALSALQGLFGCGSTGSDTDYLYLGISSGDNIIVSGGITTFRITNAVFRDPSAWYHIVLTVDTTNATANNRILLYVNGVSQSFSTTNNPALSANTGVNQAALHSIARRNAADYCDGYLAEVNFIDGQALTPSSFGQTDATTGVWQPKAYTGTYGTNGFYLKFADASAATAAAIGKDSSGNGNNWTPTNISVTTGVTYDAMVDSPTNSAAASNYATLNPLDKSSIQTLSNANLTVASSGTVGLTKSTLAVNSNKWYWEGFLSALSSNAGFCDFGFVLSTIAPTAQMDGVSGSWCVTDSGTKVDNGTNTTSWAGSNFVAGTDVLMCAVDLDSGKAWFGKNGTWFQSGNPATGANAAVTTSLTGANITPAFGSSAGTSRSFTFDVNFGQRPFSYTPPSGFKALNTSNLTTPTIANGAQYMAAVTYNGTSASNTVTATSSNSGNNPLAITFQPDLVWIKSRSAATSHEWTDSVRGVTKSLSSNSTAAEATDTNGLTAFTASGFTVGSDSNYNNGTGPATYIAWEWSKGASQGFDIVAYTGNGSNRTISHSLGVIPSMMIVKQRTASSTTNWAVYHSALANTEYLLLNTTAAKATGATYWNSTTPTASVFSLGTAADVNTNTGTYVNWLFAPVAGYSAFGSYTGNGSTDGPFVFTGFRPRFVLIKCSSAAPNDWVIYDTSRNTYNATINRLFPDLADAESTGAGGDIDVLSNGFKIRSTYGNVNSSSATYIYAAFAENPFKYANAR